MTIKKNLGFKVFYLTRGYNGEVLNLCLFKRQVSGGIRSSIFCSKKEMYSGKVWQSKVENNWYLNYTKRYNSNMVSLNSDDSVVNAELGYDVKLREEFLNNNSHFLRRLRDIVKKAKNEKEKEKLIEIQKEIEVYCIEDEKELVENLMSGDGTKRGKYDPVLLRLGLDLNEKIVHILNIFIQPYKKNGYEKLIFEMENKKDSANLYLLIFALKYKIKESELNVLKKKGMDEGIEREEFIKNYSNGEYDRYIKYKKNEDSILVNIIISILINSIQRFFKKDDLDSVLAASNLKLSDKDDELVSPLSDEGFSVGSDKSYANSDLYNNSSNHISRYYLVNMLANELLKRAPKELPKLFLDSFVELNEEKRLFIKKYYEESFIFNDDPLFKNIIGNSLLELMIEKLKVGDKSVLVVSEMTYSNKKKNKYISINEEFADLFSRKLYRLDKLPMIVQPGSWEKRMEGGSYLTSEFNNLVDNDLIHENNRNFGKSIITEVQKQTIDYLNKQKFKINSDILTFLLKEFKEEGSIFFSKQNKLIVDDDWKNLSSSKKREIIVNNSKFRLYQWILSLAVVYEDIDFYIPTYMDFRGRIYSFVDYLNYQGEDLARSLIEFSNGCEIDEKNIVYILQHIANTGGKSKTTMSYKNRWSLNLINDLNVLPYNLDLSEDTAKNLKDKKNRNKEYGCGIASNPGFKIDQLVQNSQVKDIILKTNEKLQFLIALYNTIKCLLYSKEQFNTPICFDATCSGFQHLAALFRDIELAVLSNITSKSKIKDGKKVIDVEVPGDIYKEVAEKVKSDIDKDEEIPSELKEKLLKINIDRKLLKKPVMTIPYNVGLESMGEQLKNDGFFLKKIEINNLKKNVKDFSYFYVVSDNLIKDEYKNENVTLTNKELNHFFLLLYNSVYKTFPSLKKYVTFLNEFARIFSKFNIPIVWTTPVGMKIEMKYLKTRWVKGKNLYSKKPASSVILPILKEIDKKANKIAFLPNFIHSMDSANIQGLVQKLRGKKVCKMNLFTIHDCFATTPESMEYLNLAIRETFSDMYFKQDYIKKMYKDFLLQLSNYTTIYKKLTNGKVEKVYYPDYDKELLEGEALFVIYTEDGKNIEIEKYLDFSNLIDSRITILYIPEIPYNIKRSDVTKIFEEGIKSSVYFIN